MNSYFKLLDIVFKSILFKLFDIDVHTYLLYFFQGLRSAGVFLINDVI